ncbi:MAG: M24 family metallopeptidase [Thermodesulfobacteriota bacterium]
MIEQRRRFTAKEYGQRQARVREAMRSQHIELLISCDPANMYWLTGYDGWSFYVPQAVVMDADQTLFIFLRPMDGSGAELTTDLAGDDIVVYPESCIQSPDSHPMEFLAETLKERGLEKKRTGVEKDGYYLSVRALETLRATLAGATFHDTSQLVGRLRAVKSARELDYMNAAGKIVEAVYEKIMDIAEPGMRKNDLIAEICHTAIRGTDDCFGDYTSIVPIIGVGEESRAAHMTWDGQLLEREVGMFFELAGAHARYHCPCSRTLYFGTPPAKYYEIEQVINETIAVTLEAFRPGNSCADVADVFYTTLKKLGYEKEARYAYPIGVSYPPDWGEHTMSVRSGDHTLLEANMTFHLMSALWFDDWGFETTESLVVTEQGGQCLSNVPRRLLVK